VCSYFLLPSFYLLSFSRYASYFTGESDHPPGQDVVEYTARQAEKAEREKREKIEIEAEQRAIERLQEGAEMTHRLERANRRSDAESDRKVNVKKGGSGSQILFLVSNSVFSFDFSLLICILKIHGALSKAMRFHITQNWQPYLPFFGHLGTFYAIDLTVAIDNVVSESESYDDDADQKWSRRIENKNKNKNDKYKDDKNHKDSKKNNRDKKTTNNNNNAATSPVQPTTSYTKNPTNTTKNNTAPIDMTSEQVSLLKSLLQEEKITTPVILVGHYYGARVALELAKEIPEAVKEIVLIAPNLNKNFVSGLPDYVRNKRTLFFWVKTDPLSSFKRFMGYKDHFTKHTLMAFDPPGNTLSHTLEFLMTEKYQESLADWIDAD